MKSDAARWRGSPGLRPKFENSRKALPYTTVFQALEGFYASRWSLTIRRRRLARLSSRIIFIV